MRSKHIFKKMGYLAFILSGAFMVVALVLSALPVNPASAAGAIWTTNNSCGAPQDVNIYAIGDHVFINGSDFSSNTSYPWSITGKPGGASSDPGIVVASGTHATDANGAVCFDAYTIAADDDGEYGVVFGDKSDNYRVQGTVLPTSTSTSTAVSTDTPTSTSTSVFTNTSTSTSTAISTNTSTSTLNPQFPPRPSNTPTRTHTPIPPTPTWTLRPQDPTYTPIPPTPTWILVTVTPPALGGSNVIYPVTGVDQGAFSRGLPRAFAYTCLGFLGLGLVLIGIDRKLDK